MKKKAAKKKNKMEKASCKQAVPHLLSLLLTVDVMWLADWGPASSSQNIYKKQKQKTKDCNLEL